MTFEEESIGMSSMYEESVYEDQNVLKDQSVNASLQPFVLSASNKTQYLRKIRHKDTSHIQIHGKFNNIDLGEGIVQFTSINFDEDKKIGLMWISNDCLIFDGLEKKSRHCQDITNKFNENKGFRNKKKTEILLFFPVHEILDLVQQENGDISIQLQGRNTFIATALNGSLSELMEAWKFNSMNFYRHVKLDDNNDKIKVEESQQLPEYQLHQKQEQLNVDKQVEKSAAQGRHSNELRATEVKIESNNEIINNLIRKYVQLNPESDEAQEIAKKITNKGSYPISTSSLSTKNDNQSAIKIGTTSLMSKVLELMKQSNEQSQLELDQATHTRIYREENGVNQYIDTRTSEMISADEYRHRYLDYIHLKRKNESAGLDYQKNHEEILHGLHNITKELGMDYGSSCVMDENFINTYVDFQKVSDLQSEQYTARKKLWTSWLTSLSQYYNTLYRNTESNHPSLSSELLAKTNEQNQSVGVSTVTDSILSTPNQNFGNRVQGKRKRKSIDYISMSDLQEFQLQESNTKRIEVINLPEPSANSRLRSPDRVASQFKFPRSLNYKYMNQKQQIISNETSAKNEGRAFVTPKKQRIHRTTTPISKSVGPKKKTTHLCRLCFDDKEEVCMDPCNHWICGKCWRRITSSDPNRLKGTCPWDEETVTRKITADHQLL